MTTTSSSSGLTFKLHPVSERLEEKEGERDERSRGIGKTIFSITHAPRRRSQPPPFVQQQNNNEKKKQLVVVNISDHVTRAKVSSSGGSGGDEASATACVAGCLLGSVGAATRTVDVANSFELVVPSPGAQPDAALLRRRLDQCEGERRRREKERGGGGRRETTIFSTQALAHSKTQNSKN